MANFSLATEESYKDGSGEWQKRTQWHRVRAWGEVADAVSKYLRKGSYVHIEGKLSSNEWVDRQNNKRTSIQIIATGLRFLDMTENTVSAQPWRARGHSERGPGFTRNAPGNGRMTPADEAPAPPSQ